MADKNFTQFDLKTTLSLNDFLVGYVENGTNELRTKISDINSFILDKQTLSFNESNKNLTLSNGKFASLSSINIAIIKGETYSSDADYFIQITDYNKLLTFDNINLTNVNVIINKDLNFPVGSEIRIMRKGDGNVALSASNGVNLRSVDNSTYIRYKNSVVNLVKLEENDWLLYGDLSKLAPAFTPTPTPTPTNTETPTPTPTETPTNTPTETPTNTPTPTNTETPTPTPTETPTNTPTPTPTPTPIPITNITIDNSTVNITNNQNYIVVDNDVVSTFTLTFDGVDGVTFTDVYDINDFNNCKLTITTTSDISANKDEVFVTSSLNLSTIQDKLFTFYYFNTGSLILGASPVNLPLPTPPNLNPSWTQLGNTISVGSYLKTFDFNDIGDKLVIGTQSNTCSAYSWNGSSWNPMGNVVSIPEAGYLTPEIKISTIGAGNSTRDIFVASTPFYDSNKGRVKSYYFEPTTSEWTQLAVPLDASTNSDYFGIGIGLRNDFLAVSYQEEISQYVKYGRVKYYNLDGNWLEMDTVGIDIEYSRPTSISFTNDGRKIAIGDTSADLGSSADGLVRTYYWNNTDLLSYGQTLSGNSGAEMFGRTALLNSDGSKLIISSAKTTNNPTKYGFINTYSWDSPSSSWVQLGNSLYGDVANNELFGWNFDINDNGDRMVVFSQPKFDNYSNSNVKVYKFVNNNWIQLGQTISFFIDPDDEGTVKMNSIGDKIAISTVDGVKVYSLS
jgi:hypothetical protein